MRELYVYYRVAPAEAARARSEVLALQAELRSTLPDLSVRWLQRPPSSNATDSSPATWMEVYTRPSGLSDDDITFVLQRGTAVVRSIEGLRHPEVFSPCV